MTTANQDQKEFWNGTGGASWVAGQAEMDAFLSPFTEELMQRAAPAAGQSVLDIGCGTGDTSLRWAAAMGARGHVLGVDISEPMLALARARVAAAGAPNVHFALKDAQSDSLDADLTVPADLVISRFGVMFFDDPPRAFANIRGHTKPGGRLAFVCWQPVRENEWVHIGLAIAKKHVDFPPPPDPYAPGPFAFADVDRTLGILADAGWSDGAAVPFVTKINQGSTARGAAEGLMLRGPISRVMAEASDAQKQAVLSDLEQALAAKMRGGGIMLGGASWVVTATA